MSAATTYRAAPTPNLRTVSRCIAITLTLALTAFVGPVQLAKANSETKVSLSGLGGEWRGSGWGLRHATAPQEQVRCRMRTRYHTRARRFALSGRCAATSRSFTILGHIAEYPDSDRITGRWVNPDGFGSMNIRGSRNANTFTFTFRAEDRNSKETRTYRTTWQMSQNSMTVRTSLADHDDTLVGLIQFER